MTRFDAFVDKGLTRPSLRYYCTAAVWCRFDLMVYILWWSSHRTDRTIIMACIVLGGLYFIIRSSSITDEV